MTTNRRNTISSLDLGRAALRAGSAPAEPAGGPDIAAAKEADAMYAWATARPKPSEDARPAERLNGAGTAMTSGTSPPEPPRSELQAIHETCEFLAQQHDPYGAFQLVSDLLRDRQRQIEFPKVIIRQDGSDLLIGRQRFPLDVPFLKALGVALRAYGGAYCGPFVRTLGVALPAYRSGAYRGGQVPVAPIWPNDHAARQAIRIRLRDWLNKQTEPQCHLLARVLEAVVVKKGHVRYDAFKRDFPRIEIVDMRRAPGVRSPRAGARRAKVRKGKASA